jgi:hypothetical protein
VTGGPPPACWGINGGAGNFQAASSLAELREGFGAVSGDIFCRSVKLFGERYVRADVTEL